MTRIAPITPLVTPPLAPVASPRALPAALGTTPAVGVPETGRVSLRRFASSASQFSHQVSGAASSGARILQQASAVATGLAVPSVAQAGGYGLVDLSSDLMPLVDTAILGGVALGTLTAAMVAAGGSVYAAGRTLNAGFQMMRGWSLPKVSPPLNPVVEINTVAGAEEAPAEVAPEAPAEVAPEAPAEVAPEAPAEVAPEAPAGIQLPTAPRSSGPDVQMIFLLPANELKPGDHYQVIADLKHRGNPTADPTESVLVQYRSAYGRSYAITSYGGPNSKYNSINEDSHFELVDAQGRRVAGVIDGAGGSGQVRINGKWISESPGYYGGRAANQGLVAALNTDNDLEEVFRQAYEYVSHNAYGAYAAGAVARIRDDLFVELATVADSRAVVLRQGDVLYENELQSLGQDAAIRRGDKSQIWTFSHNNVITNSIGTTGASDSEYREPEQSLFQGEVGDQILLFSDGIGDVISPYELSLWSQDFAGRPDEFVEHVIETAKQRWGSRYMLEYMENGEVKRVQMDFAQYSYRSGDNMTFKVIVLGDE